MVRRDAVGTSAMTESCLKRQNAPVYKRRQKMYNCLLQFWQGADLSVNIIENVFDKFGWLDAE